MTADVWEQPVIRWDAANERMECSCGEQVSQGDAVAVLATGERVCQGCIEYD